MKKGFTLIELLVVVLIIGILAAVALPQYERAVMKARYTKAMIWTKAVKDALEMYYLANGSYPANFDDLDVDVPTLKPRKGHAILTYTKAASKLAGCGISVPEAVCWRCFFRGPDLWRAAVLYDVGPFPVCRGALLRFLWCNDGC